MPPASETTSATGHREQRADLGCGHARGALRVAVQVWVEVAMSGLLVAWLVGGHSIGVHVRVRAPFVGEGVPWQCRCQQLGAPLSSLQVAIGICCARRSARGRSGRPGVTSSGRGHPG